MIDSFGLNKVWPIIQQTGSSLSNQFIAVLTQLLFADSITLNKAKPVIAQLALDLTIHSDLSAQFIRQCITQLNILLLNDCKKETYYKLINYYFHYLLHHHMFIYILL